MQVPSVTVTVTVKAPVVPGAAKNKTAAQGDSGRPKRAIGEVVGRQWGSRELSEPHSMLGRSNSKPQNRLQKEALAANQIN